MAVTPYGGKMLEAYKEAESLKLESFWKDLYVEFLLCETLEDLRGCWEYARRITGPKREEKPEWQQIKQVKDRMKAVLSGN